MNWSEAVWCGECVYKFFFSNHILRWKYCIVIIFLQLHTWFLYLIWIGIFCVLCCFILLCHGSIICAAAFFLWVTVFFCVIVLLVVVYCSVLFVLLCMYCFVFDCIYCTLNTATGCKPNRSYYLSVCLSVSMCRPLNTEFHRNQKECGSKHRDLLWSQEN